MCDPISATIGVVGGLIGMSQMSAPSMPEPPKMPDPIEPPPPPQQEKAPDPINMGKDFEDQQKNTGQISTWLTGADGALVNEENKKKKSLLGG